MKKLVILIMTIFLTASCSQYWSPTNADHIIITNPWTEIAAMPTARHALTASFVNGKIYCIGGEVHHKLNESTWSRTLLDNVEVYDPQNNVWQVLAPMPHTRAYHGAAVVNGKIYIIGGWSYSNAENILMFEPVNNSWTILPNIPIHRATCSVTVYNNKIYIFGGTTDWGDYINIVEEFDPATGIITQKTSMPTGRQLCAAVTVNDKIFVIGGRYATGYSQDYSKVEVYHPKSDSWQTYKNACTDMPDDGTLDLEGAVLLENKIHILGEFWHFEYDPTSQVSVKKSLRDLYVGQSGYEILNSKIYSFGGIDYDYDNYANNLTTDRCFVYDPGKDEWK